MNFTPPSTKISLLKGLGRLYNILKINTMKNKNFLLNFMRRKATAAIKMSNAVEKILLTILVQQSKIKKQSYKIRERSFFEK